jgi:rhodanese-related sulfurtransferase
MEPAVDTAAMSAAAAVAGGAVLVDVRGAAEFEARHISIALSLPLGDLLDFAIAAPAPGALREADGAPKAVVVHCASGARSATAAAQFAAAGFTTVVDLGPMDDWPGEGLPSKPPTFVKCDGCGAVMPDSEFQRHCGDVEHDDDFMYTCSEAVEQASAVVTPQGAGGAKIDFSGSAAAQQGGSGSAAVLPLPLVPLDPPNPCRNWMGTWASGPWCVPPPPPPHYLVLGT